MTISRRTFAKTMGAGVAALTLPPVAIAQRVDVLKIIVPFPPAGPTDALARQLAAKLTGTYAKSVVVDNRPGGSGRIGFTAVKAAPADGTTLVVAPQSTVTVVPFTMPKQAYSPADDLAPISRAALLPQALAVGPSVPASVRTLNDFLNWAKENPTKASFGSPGAGAVPHFIGVVLSKTSGVPLTHVAYRGGAPGVADLVAGQLPSMITTEDGLIAHHRAGKIRILATSMPERGAFTSDIPTFTESGHGYINYGDWLGIWAHRDTAPDTVTMLERAVNTALRDPDLLQAMNTLNLQVKGSTAAEMRTIQRAEITRWGPIVKDIGFTMDS